MKQALENGLTIGDLIESLQDDGAYVSISVLPKDSFSVYVGWWGGINYHTCLGGYELIDLLCEAINRVAMFLDGDSSCWQPDGEIPVMTDAFSDEECAECLILK
jgi:hypothetical protein